MLSKRLNQGCSTCNLHNFSMQETKRDIKIPVYKNAESSIYSVERLGSVTLEIVFAVDTQIVDMKLYESLPKNAITTFECLGV